MSPHIDDVVAPLALGELPEPEAERARSHLARCPRCAGELAATVELLGGLSLAPGPIAPSPEVRARLLDELGRGGRLHRFADRVAELLGVAGDKARAALDRLDQPGAWSPLPRVAGVELCLPPDKAPRLKGCAVAFLRLAPGGLFPTHDHLGGERVLVLQGGYLDLASGLAYHPGEVHASDEGTSHAFRALGGPPCVVLAVVEGHIRVGEVVI